VLVLSESVAPGETAKSYPSTYKDHPFLCCSGCGPVILTQFFGCRRAGHCTHIPPTSDFGGNRRCSTVIFVRGPTSLRLCLVTTHILRSVPLWIQNSRVEGGCTLSGPKLSQRSVSYVSRYVSQTLHIDRRNFILQGFVYLFIWNFWV